MFDMFVLVFLSFRFNKIARVEKRGILSKMWRKLKSKETLKSLGRTSHEKHVFRGVFK